MYVVQHKLPNGAVECSLMDAQDILDLCGSTENFDATFAVFDGRRFGGLDRLKHLSDSFGEPNYHRFVDPHGYTTSLSGYAQNQEK